MPPEHHKLDEKTRVEWEEIVFKNASYFRVSWREGPGKIESHVYSNFPDAAIAAFDNKRKLVYAVTGQGRWVCLPRSEWRKYLDICKANTVETPA